MDTVAQLYSSRSPVEYLTWHEGDPVEPLNPLNKLFQKKKKGEHFLSHHTLSLLSYRDLFDSSLSFQWLDPSLVDDSRSFAFTLMGPRPAQ